MTFPFVAFFMNISHMFAQRFFQYNLRKKVVCLIEVAYPHGGLTGEVWGGGGTLNLPDFQKMSFWGLFRVSVDF